MNKKKLLAIIILFNSILIQAQSWNELGTGNSALNPDSTIFSICSDPSGNIYAAGLFTDGTNASSGKYYVAKWNGNSWSELGTGSNFLNALPPFGDIRTVYADASGNIYAVGEFPNASGYFYVAKWDGNTWSELGTGTNALNANSDIVSICSDVQGNIYAAGNFDDGGSNPTKYVAKWNGTNWNRLGTGTNSSNTHSPIASLCSDPSGNIYAPATSFDSNYSYVVKWNGSSWSELGTGSNAINAHGAIWTMCSDPSGNIYAGGNFTNASGYWYVAKWDGNTWSELGTGSTALNANYIIKSICSDASGNIYATGYFTNANGKFYVAKWNGTMWTELGTGANALNANNAISSICTFEGAIYSAGWFTNSSGKHYVARFVDSIPTIQATDVTFSSVIQNQFNVSWTRGNGQNCAVFIKATNSGSPVPTNGLSYTALSIFGSGTQIGASGWYCIYNGTGTSTTVTGLNSNSEYTIMVVEYNGLDGLEAYLTTSATGNPATIGFQPNATMAVNTLVCQGTNAIISLTNSTGSLPLSYQWHGPDGIISGATSSTLSLPNIQPGDSGYYYCVISNGYGIDTTNNSLLIVNPMAIVSAGSNQTINSGDTVALTATGASSYTWNPGNLSGASVSVSPASTQTYTVVGRDANGCTDTASVTITVIVNSATAIIDGTIKKVLEVYPNPTKSDLTIDSPEDGQVIIYNSLGEVMAIQNISVGNTTINLEKLNIGVYTVYLKGQNNSYAPVKVVKD